MENPIEKSYLLLFVGAADDGDVMAFNTAFLSFCSIERRKKKLFHFSKLKMLAPDRIKIFILFHKVNDALLA